MTNTKKHTEETDRRYIVCPGCGGEGTTGPGWVYTQEDRDEMGYEWDEHMEDMREGRFDIVCEVCNGKRVVREDCECTDCDRDRQEIWEMEAMERAERAFGC